MRPSDRCALLILILILSTFSVRGLAKPRRSDCLSPRLNSPLKSMIDERSINEDSGLDAFNSLKVDDVEIPSISSREVCAWLSKSAQSYGPWSRFAALARSTLWRFDLSSTTLEHIFSQNIPLLSFSERLGPYDLNASRLWIKFQRALDRRSLKNATALSQELSLIRGFKISAQPISPQEPLRAKDWRENPSVFDDYALIDAEAYANPTGIYALWSFHSDQDFAYLHLGHRGAVRGWLNGEVIGASLSKERMWIDQTVWPIRLSRGQNTLILHLDERSSAVIRWSDQRGRLLSFKTLEPPWDRATEASPLLPPPPIKTLWARAEARLSADPDRWSDDDLLGLALYAQLSSTPEAERLSGIVEAHLRWEKSPSLTLSEIFTALTPPQVKAQAWGDYPLPLKRYKGVEGVRHLHLLLERAHDHALARRPQKALQDIDIARGLYPQSPDVLKARASWLDERGASYTKTAFLMSALRYHPHRIDLVHAYTQALQEVKGRRVALNFLTPRLGLMSPPSADIIDLQALQPLHLWLELMLSSTRANSIDQSAKPLLISDKKGEPNRRYRTLTRGPKGWPIYLEIMQRLVDRGDALAFRQWLNLNPLPDHPKLLTLEARSALLIGDLSSAKESLHRALMLTPDHPAALDLIKQIDGLKAELPLGPKTEKLLKRVEEDVEDRTWREIRAAAPAESLYHHLSMNFDAQGRLIKRFRQLLLIKTPEGAQRLRRQEVTLHPTRHELTLESAKVWRETSSGFIWRPPLSRSQKSLSEPAYRLYYDLIAEVIDFGPLRSGEVIELSWKLRETQPDPQGINAHGEVFAFESRIPRHEVVLELGSTALKRFHTQLTKDALSLTHSAQGQSQFMRAKHLKPIPYEPHQVRGTSLFSTLYLSTLKDWQSVEILYRALLGDRASATPKLCRLAQEWTKQRSLQSPLTPIEREETFLRALYTQVTGRVRYVGLEFGRHSFQPAPPEQTLDRGFGDCKDRAALMIALASCLKIPLEFVMVRTASMGRLPRSGTASLNAFNHAALYSPSLDRYFDPTVSHHDIWALPYDDQGAQVIRVSAPKKTILPRSSNSALSSSALSSSALSSSALSSSALSAPTPSSLLTIPFSSPSAHLSHWDIEVTDQTTGQVHVDWTLRGVLASRVRRALDGAEEARSWVEERVQSLIPGSKVSTLRVHNLTPAQDPLELSFSLMTSAGFTADPLRLFSGMRFVGELAPTTTRQTDLRVTPRDQRICLNAPHPSALSKKTEQLNHLIEEHKNMTDQNLARFGALKLTLSASKDRQQLCLSLSLIGQVIATSSYTGFRDWLRGVEQIVQTLSALR